MNIKWSTKVQGINTLDKSRSTRFKGYNLNNIVKLLGIKDNMSILEVGCGPGTFTRNLNKKVSNLDITGVDLDLNFIKYCKERAKEEGLSINYLTSNALQLPFSNNSFDICTSHTVIEHVPNYEFLKEQYRVCKQGGRVAVMTICGSLSSEKEIEVSEKETELFEKFGDHFKTINQKLNVAQYSANPQYILKQFEKAGFKSIQLNFLCYVN